MSKKRSKRNEEQAHNTHSGQSPGETKDIFIVSVVATYDTQSRLEINQEVVNEYAEAICAGITFPPVAVFKEGDQYWLGDGFHRLEAAKKLGKAEISAVVRPGTKKDAILYAIGANRDHGLRRSNDDKRRAVRLAIIIPELAELSSRELADYCGVSHTFVAEVRNELEEASVNALQPEGTSIPNDGSDSAEPEKHSKEVNARFVMTAKVIDDGRRQIQQVLTSIMALQKHDRGLADAETLRNILELTKKIQIMATAVAKSCEGELSFLGDDTIKARGLEMVKPLSSLLTKGNSPEQSPLSPQGQLLLIIDILPYICHYVTLGGSHAQTNDSLFRGI